MEKTNFICIPQLMKELTEIDSKFGQYVKHLIAVSGRQDKLSIEQLVLYFLEECKEKYLNAERDFAKYLLNLLIRDHFDGLIDDIQANRLHLSEIENFLTLTLDKYSNPLDITMCCLKMSYFFNNAQELSLDFVKAKYKAAFEHKMKQLKANILQYSEKIDQTQIDQMHKNIQMFIVVSYNLGCPSNVELMQRCNQSLNSVLAKGDLKNYVLKKRNNRTIYLEKLSATVCGILVYNSYNNGTSTGNASIKELHILRNIFLDLEMAEKNTRDSLVEASKRTQLCLEKVKTLMENIVKINLNQKEIHFLGPYEIVREINTFCIFFNIYKECVQKIREIFERTQYLIEIERKKFECCKAKINDILKFRSAVESKIIFPHFIYIAEIWNTLILYLNHLIEINKVKDILDELFTDDLENMFHRLVEQHFSCINKNNIDIMRISAFDKILPKREEVLFNAVPTNTKNSMQLIENISSLKDFCFLTMILTDGLLVPSNVTTRLFENSEQIYGFANNEFCKFVQLNLNGFRNSLEETITKSIGLMLLFQVDHIIMECNLCKLKLVESKFKTQESQTNCANGEIDAVSSDATWNIWDYHRETIKIANIRQRLTHSTQSNVTFGRRCAQNQVKALQKS